MKRVPLCLAIALLVAAAATLFVANRPQASNQAFKIDYPLYAPGAALPEGGSSASGTNSLCLPYLQRSDLATASDLAADIDAQAGASTVVSIARLRPDDNGFDIYDGSAPSDFPLEAGVEYRVVVSQSLTYTIFGSHDDGATIALLGADDPASLDGSNAFCPPYHSLSTSASELFEEVGSAAGDPGVVSGIGRFLRSSDTIETYTGASSLADFPLTPGEGYRIGVDRTVNLVPSHR